MSDLDKLRFDTAFQIYLQYRRDIKLCSPSGVDFQIIKDIWRKSLAEAEFIIGQFYDK